MMPENGEVTGDSKQAIENNYKKCAIATFLLAQAITGKNMFRVKNTRVDATSAYKVSSS